MSNDDRISDVPLVDAVDGFMRLAGQTTGRFNARQACLYTGLVLEEVGEMIDVIMEGCLTPAQTASLMALGTTLARCLKWHPQGIESWSPSDWLTAVTGELGELASLLKMRNRERDGLPGNKFSPTQKQIADELADVLADVLTYLDLLAAVLGVDLGRAAVQKFNEVSERVGFPDRIDTDAFR